MLKAFSKKYKGRAILVGKTSFSFNEDGLCEVEDVGNVRLDYEALLTKNHVNPVVEEELSEDIGEPRQMDERVGIDEELLAEESDLEEEDLDEELDEDLEEEDLDEEEVD